MEENKTMNRIKIMKENKFFRKTIRISALITESAIESGLILTLTESDDIVNIVGARNITNENDKLMLSMAKLVALKLHVLGNDLKPLRFLVLPLQSVQRMIPTHGRDNSVKNITKK